MKLTGFWYLKKSVVKQAYNSSAFHSRINENWGGGIHAAQLTQPIEESFVVKILMGFGMNKCFISKS